MSHLQNTSSSPPLQVKPRPSLLPAFEPSSSSSSPLPRPLKRRYDGSPAYPTPVPTSATGILPSSPPPPRPFLHRAISERVPLGTLPSARIPSNGDALLLGRSSNASHYQLSANRLISRIHIRATHDATKGKLGHGEITLECIGWNGAIVHCKGNRYSLRKGDTFSSDDRKIEIMVDVQDARVVIEWPEKEEETCVGWSTDEEASPVLQQFGSSPPVRVLRSPVSPSPRGFEVQEEVDIFEDEEENDENLPPTESFTQRLVDAREVELEEDDNDEENDPIVHAFGPFGEDLQKRMAAIGTGSPRKDMSSSLSPISSGSPSPKKVSAPIPVSPGKVKAEPVSSASSPKQASAASPSPKPSAAASPSPKTASTPQKSATSPPNISPIRNHIINQLAFSRLHSLPLSTLFSNLPSSLTTSFTSSSLKTLLESTACVGEIARQGRDAAGKPLENEYYYVAEGDEDAGRREACGGLGKTGLRQVRRSHKQYYWKKPRC